MRVLWVMTLAVLLTPVSAMSQPSAQDDVISRGETFVEDADRRTFVLAISRAASVCNRLPLQGTRSPQLDCLEVLKACQTASATAEEVHRCMRRGGFSFE